MKINSVRTVLLAFATLVAIVVVPASVMAQARPALSGDVYHGSPSNDSFHGFNAYETFRGVVRQSGALMKLDSSVGYDFNRTFGVFAGVPFYFTNSFDNGTSTGSQTASGLGDAYVGAEVYLSSKLVRYSSSVTVGLATGNTAKGFSSGKMTADWANHFRRSFGRLTPQFSVGVGNSAGVGIGAVPSSDLVSRSLSATTTFLHMEEGADLDVTRKVYVGGAAYQIIPTKDQASASAAAAAATIVRENGFDAWVGFEPNRLVNTEIGYSRSTTLALNSVSFKVGLNVGQLLRRNAQH